MIYQLPNGKTINISIDAYLSLSDDDLKYLNEMNVGSSSAENPFVTDEELEDLDLIVDDTDDDIYLDSDDEVNGSAV
jgi:hypothetical protein